MDKLTLETMSDAELLSLAQNRNQEAFSELMRRSSSSSMKLALSILRDRQEAEDEVQNSYWKAWVHVGQFQGDSKFSTWVSRIVVNQCLMRLRQARRVTFHYLDQPVAGEKAPSMQISEERPNPEDQIQATEMSSLLHTEIRRLPPLLRQPLILRDLKDLPISEIAENLGISITATKSRLLRARIELRKRLERHGIHSANPAAPLPNPL